MMRREAAASASKSGSSHNNSVAKAHDKLEQFCAENSRSRIAAAEIDSSKGPCFNFRVATAHAVLARFWPANSEILSIDGAAIAFSSGWFRKLRIDKDHAVILNSLALKDVTVTIAAELNYVVRERGHAAALLCLAKRWKAVEMCVASNSLKCSATKPHKSAVLLFSII
jgi:hypothetical protein